MAETRIADLREQITIEQAIETDDDGGGQTVAWQTFVADLWARVLPASGREINLADRIQPRTAYAITVRYRTDIDPGMRVNWGGRIMAITQPPTDKEGTRHWTTIIAEEDAPT